jgi:hypothetical protein
VTKHPKENLSVAEIMQLLQEVQLAWGKTFRHLHNAHGWKVPDARLQVFHSCSTVVGHARFSMGLVTFARTNGAKEKAWWEKWTLYDAEQSFKDWPKFETFVDDSCRQYVHRVQEQIFIFVQIYVESFLRSLARQMKSERNEFWKLKQDFLEGVLGLTSDELVPLSVYQHLRNSLHNKGLHHNPKYTDLLFKIDDWTFQFSHGHAVQISWEHIGALQLATAALLAQIVELPNVIEDNDGV